MIRTFRYPLRPTKAQAQTLRTWLLACQQLYNAALEARRDAWRKAHVGVSYNQQTKELTQLRTEDLTWAAIPVRVARSALRHLDEAFRGFFRRVKRGEKAGYPRFRARDRYESFGIGRARVEDSAVWVPKLGPVRFYLYRPLRGIIRDVVIRRTTKGWYVCFACDLGEAPNKQPVQRAVGVDVGLNTFVMLSNGEAYENPRYFRHAETQLAKRQRVLARRQRGSNSRRRAKCLVAHAHEHVRSQRLDYARKLACDLFKQYDLVAYEDLQIRNMIRSTLAKSISDAAWGVFIHCLTCKAEEAGKYAVAVDPRGTSQRCSRCGAIVPKTLSDRTHACTCGLNLDRDHNAAINILALGWSVASTAAPAAATEARRSPDF